MGKERIAPLLRLGSFSSWPSSASQRHQPQLYPFEDGPRRMTRRVRLFLGFYLYKKIFLFAIISLTIVLFIFVKNSNAYAAHAVSGWISESTSTVKDAASIMADLVSTHGEDGVAADHDPGDDDMPDEEIEDLNVDQGSPEQQEALRQTPWLRFPHLNGYFNGLKTIVNISDHVAEYPNPAVKAPVRKRPPNRLVPKPRSYNPYPKDPSRRQCYLDRNNSIPAPTLYAYHGLPPNMPDAAIGSHEVLGIRDDVCFDRFGRYGPYGLGYKKEAGGSEVGLDTESSGSEVVWAESGQIDYANIDWNDVQERCFAANEDRFAVPDPETDRLEIAEGKKSRTAVVIRLYTGFEWTELAIVNFRALITEVSLHTGGEYDVHFLLHVRDNDVPIWADEETAQKLLESNVPAEFRGLVTLWNEAQMRLFYPDRFQTPLKNPSNFGIYGVYRSAHMPLQVFAMQHPEYEHFWNWEMDIRFLGNWFEFFDRVSSWAKKQPRALLWERSARYYIPSLHGSWENFTVVTNEETKRSGKEPIFGPVDFREKKPLTSQKNIKVLPDSCDGGKDPTLCGVGEAADIITLNPLFNVENSGWVFSDDVTGYHKDPPPPRRCAIVTASRMSRRLLLAMHEEVWRHHHTMFTEMFPATVALHHGFKAAYAPHPIFVERAWDPLGSSIAAALNAGDDHSTSGTGSPFHPYNEHRYRGMTWYYNSEFAGMLWRRWLGYPQFDGRGKIGAADDKGKMRGGKEEEEGERSSGRMCLRSMLLHPIKQERPS